MTSNKSVDSAAALDNINADWYGVIQVMCEDVQLEDLTHTHRHVTVTFIN